MFSQWTRGISLQLRPRVLESEEPAWDFRFTALLVRRSFLDAGPPVTGIASVITSQFFCFPSDAPCFRRRPAGGSAACFPSQKVCLGFHWVAGRKSRRVKEGYSDRFTH